MIIRHQNLLESSGRWSILSLVMSIGACYGTLGLLGLLTALGMSLAINAGIWVGAVLVFAWAAVALIGIGARIHSSFVPVTFGLIGAALLTYTLLVDYRAEIEIVAFLTMTVAAVYDYIRRRRYVEWLSARPAGRSI